MLYAPMVGLLLSVTLGAQGNGDQPAASPPPSGPRIAAERVGAEYAAANEPDADTVRVRRKAVHLSEAYEFRRKVHMLASYATIPLFVAEYAAGEQLMKGSGAASWARDYHSFGAGAIATLFGVNTVTGALNWWETRDQTEGRTWRTVHSVLMLAADAGFVATGALAEESDEGFGTRGRVGNQSRTHRAVAITSMSVATVSYLMMLKPLRRD